MKRTLEKMSSGSYRRPVNFKKFQGTKDLKLTAVDYTLLCNKPRRTDNIIALKYIANEAQKWKAPRGPGGNRCTSIEL